MILRGGDISAFDLEKLLKCGISRELAESACLRRVDSTEGAAIVGRDGAGDYSGIVFPYIWPGEDHVRDYRLRRDRPEMEARADGSFKERQKYISPPGRGNMLYFVPGTAPGWLSDPAIPILITEGEKKTLALWAVSWAGLGDGADFPRFLSVGLSGVWNFRGTTGKTNGPDGDRRDVKGVIPDIEKIAWKKRKVTVVFDRNALSSDSVQAARHTLTNELRKRGAEVYWFAWPSDTPANINGIDDLLGPWGHERVLDALRLAKPVNQQRKSVQIPKSRMVDDVMSDSSIQTPEMLIEGLIPKGRLVLLGGRPKDGKSWMACQIALAVAGGVPLGGSLVVEQPGRVQLWALEDQLVLTKDKLGKLLGKERPPREIRLFEELPVSILNGGDEILHESLVQHPADLIILDSLFKLTGGPKQRNSDIMQADYDVIDRVRKVAHENNCAAMIVMHTKKGARGGDPIENIIGTSGISAAADAVVELKRTGATEGKLTVVGRLVRHGDYLMAWHDDHTWGWTIDGAAEDASIGETMQEVLDYLEAQGASKVSPMAVALHRTFQTVWHALLRLNERGKVMKGRDKKWDIRGEI